MQDEVKNIYRVNYNQSDNLIVHVEDRDLVFHNKNKIYVADMAEWVLGNKLEESRKPLTLATIKSEFVDLTWKETKRAKSEKYFVKNAGYSSEGEALNTVRNGNVSG